MRLTLRTTLCGLAGFLAVGTMASADEGFEPRTILVRIHPELPTFRFRIVPRTPEAWDRDWRAVGSGEAQAVDAGTIEVSAVGAPAVTQRLRVRTIAHPAWLSDSFTAQDVNFDGYLDLSVVYAHGGKWSQAVFWLFDPSSGRFVRNALARDLSRISYAQLTVHPERREIHTTAFWGHCYPSRYVYVISEGRLVLSEAEELDPNAGCAPVFKRRVNGKLRRVNEKVTSHVEALMGAVPARFIEHSSPQAACDHRHGRAVAKHLSLPGVSKGADRGLEPL